MNKTRPLTERERDELYDAYQRMQDQASIAQSMVAHLVCYDNLSPMKKVRPDFCVGDFLVFDLKRHPEWRLK